MRWWNTGEHVLSAPYSPASLDGSIPIARAENEWRSIVLGLFFRASAFAHATSGKHPPLPATLSKRLASVGQGERNARLALVISACGVRAIDFDRPRVILPNGEHGCYW
jgi:hypothetical protein